MRAEAGVEGSSGVCYAVGPRAVFQLAEMGWGEQKEKAGKSREHKRK